MKAFFTKLVGDNYRYIAEMNSGEVRAKAVEDARMNYEAAQEVPIEGCNPIKLSINLNMAVFYYEVTHNMPKAQEITDSALQAALEKIDDLGEEDFKEAKQMIELLKENLAAWKEEQEEKNRPIDLVDELDPRGGEGR